MSKTVARIRAQEVMVRQKSGLGGAQLVDRPAVGWIKTVRIALGMSASDLARRMGVEVSTVLRIESSETKDRIKLETMKKLANELGCDVVYALVPRQPIEATVRTQALGKARQRLARVQQTMLLEQQGLTETVLARLIDQEADELIRTGKVW